MSRRKTEADLKLQLQYAEARKAYVAPTRETASSTKQRKSIRVQYAVMSRSTTQALNYTVHAPLKSLEFFGDGTGTELGLKPAAGDSGGPRGFKPAKIHAFKSNAEGEIKKAKDSGRPYTNYAVSGGQSTFSAPVCSSEGIAAAITIIKSIATAKKESIGAYGRIWFTPEFYVIQE